MKTTPLLFALLFLSCPLAGCPVEVDDDVDGDGHPASEDCDDTDPSVHPDAGETCDDEDNDCDGLVDEGFDEDADGYAPCGVDADCNDADFFANPGAVEQCNGQDDDCDGVVDEDCPTDLDGDGFLAPEDCDDDNNLVHPGADEICDGADNNCDGTVDEGWDIDGDGVPPCGPGPDCDEGDPTIYPGAPEVCDGVDQDCDNSIDEDFDADDDGFTTCGPSPDCDDTDPAIRPGAPELCDGLDNNCNGQVDEDTDGDNDGDGVSACNGDCDDDDATVFPGAIERPNGVDDDCNGGVDDGFSSGIEASQLQPAISPAATQAHMGDSISTDGYFDSDALSDFVAGGPLYEGSRGRAWLFLGEAYSAATPPADLVVQAFVTGDDPGDHLGHSVDLADVNGDDWDDVIIGIPQLASPSPPAGKVAIFFGGPTPPSGALDVADADVLITGDFPTEQCGTAVAGLGDVNGDTIPDLGFTCPWFNPGDGNLRGRTVIFFGRSSWAASYGADDADATIVGAVEDTFSGQALAGDFDFNADGLSDFIIGSPEWNVDQGRAVLKLGSTTGWSQGMSLDAATRSWEGPAGARFGYWLGAGDADGDEFGDLLIGSPEGASGRGTLAQLFGSAAPPPSGHCWGRVDSRVGGENVGDGTGSSAAFVDLDGDGEPELLAAFPGWDATGGDAGQVAWFEPPLAALPTVFLQSDSSASFLGEVQGDAFGSSLSRLADYNGDGAPDLVVSAPFQDSGAGNGGRLYLVHGL